MKTKQLFFYILSLYSLSACAMKSTVSPEHLVSRPTSVQATARAVQEKYKKNQPISAAMLYHLPQEIQSIIASYAAITPDTYEMACSRYIGTE